MNLMPEISLAWVRAASSPAGREGNEIAQILVGEI